MNTVKTTALNKSTAVKKMTQAEWHAEATLRFGDNSKKWRFVCPSCGNVQTINDLLQYVGIKEAAKMVYFACIGRIDGKHGNVHMGTKPGPCNYTSGGLFVINTLIVECEGDRELLPVFEFDDSCEGAH